jgi:hypothetical protein
MRSTAFLSAGVWNRLVADIGTANTSEENKIPESIDSGQRMESLTLADSIPLRQLLASGPDNFWNSAQSRLY